MTLANWDVVNRFADGSEAGNAANMYIDGDDMFSYGHHFPLLLRMKHWPPKRSHNPYTTHSVNHGFLLNADRYSSSTSRHQNECFHVATVQIPFSALSEALDIPYTSLLSKSLKKLKLIDKENERWDLIGYKRYEDGKTKRISVNEYDSIKNSEQVLWNEVNERRPEACLLQFGREKFLSSMDQDQYFLVKLPKFGSGHWDNKEDITTSDAFNTIKPRCCRHLSEYEDYERQGEWFFLDITGYMHFDTKAAKERQYKTLSSDFILPRKDRNSNPHTAIRGGHISDFSFPDRKICKIKGLNAKTPVVSGQIRHPEHRMARLSSAKEDIRFFACFENYAVDSWSAVGNVD